MTIALIDTGCANIASVRFALERAGLDHDVVTEPAGAADCDRIILPGVGAAGPAMERLKARGWSETLPQDGRPLMGICLGMQLLFEHSAEGDVDGLGLLPGREHQLRAPGRDLPRQLLADAGGSSRDPDHGAVEIESLAHEYFSRTVSTKAQR